VLMADIGHFKTVTTSWVISLGLGFEGGGEETKVTAEDP
jgi:hypothetical protein